MVVKEVILEEKILQKGFVKKTYPVRERV